MMDIAKFKPIQVDDEDTLARVSRIHLSKKQDIWHSALSSDTLITESPLQIDLHWPLAQSQEDSKTFSITMRTPGDDESLVIGLLFSEGIIASIDDVLAIDKVSQHDEQPLLNANQVMVTLAPSTKQAFQQFDRQLIANSSCGVCGKTLIKQIELKKDIFINDEEAWLCPTVVAQLPVKLKQTQSLFDNTGAVHGAAIVDEQGTILVSYEDVGRHNAVDKAVGLLVKQKFVANKHLLLVSGRVSFELMQKCVMAGIAVIVAVGAPTSLAVEIARRFNVTLIGFCRQHTMNVYHGDWRLKR